MNLVGQSASYLGGRVPPQKPKQGGGGGPMGMLSHLNPVSHLNPMQFAKIPGMSGGAGAAAGGGEAAAAGGGAELAELAPLALAL